MLHRFETAVVLLVMEDFYYYWNCRNIVVSPDDLWLSDLIEAPQELYPPFIGTVSVEMCVKCEVPTYYIRTPTVCHLHILFLVTW